MQIRRNSGLNIIFVIKLIDVYLYDGVNGSIENKTNVEVRKCCEFAFQFYDGECKGSGFEEGKDFPEYIFENYRLIQKTHKWKDWERISAPLASITLTEFGYFLHGRTYFPPNEYCFDSLGPTTAEVILHSTPTQLGLNTRMINKCCEMDYSYDAHMRKCFRSRHSWGRLKTDFSGRKSPVSNIIPGCKNLRNFTNVKLWDRPVRFSVEGSANGYVLKYQSPYGVFLRGIWRTFQNDYCIDQLQWNEAELDVPNLTLVNSNGPEIIFYCADEEIIPVQYYSLVMGGMWILISGLLLVAAVVNVYLVQRNVHGCVLSSYLLSSAILNAVAGLFIIIADDERLGCHFIDFAQKFFYLSTLCWMTMVNFDLWWDFRKLEPNARKSMKRFPFYVFVAWAVPIFIMSMCWIVGTKQRSSHDPPHCLLYDYGLILYSSGPVVLLIIFNLVLFITTAFRIRALRKATRKILRQSRCQRESFKLFSKLFLLTGPIWTLRVILLMMQINGSYLTWYGVLLEGIFVIPDVTFFLLIICHRNVLQRLRRRIAMGPTGIAPWGFLCCPQSAMRSMDNSSSVRTSPRNRISVQFKKNDGTATGENAPAGLYVISSAHREGTCPKVFV